MTQYQCPLSVSRKKVLEFIRAHPGLNTEEIASNWNHVQQVYNAIAYLWSHGFAVRDRITGAITATEIGR